MNAIPDSAPSRELIAFRVADQEFCVDMKSVRELRGWSPATPLPQAPPYVRGVINLRGTVLPIVDIGARLELAVSEPTGRHVIIVVWIGAQLVGLLVDSVSDILTAADDLLQPMPDLAGDSMQGFVSRLLTVEDRLIGLIALERILPALVTLAA